MEAIEVSLKVWGEFACFTAPEMRVERVSYPVMTPSAARGILEAIFWKPEIHYEIDRIAVLKPIQFISVRRNEIQGVIPARSVSNWRKNPASFEPYLVDSAGRDDVQHENRTQRNSVILRDVAYAITAGLIVKNPTAEDNPRESAERGFKTSTNRKKRRSNHERETTWRPTSEKGFVWTTDRTTRSNQGKDEHRIS